MTRCFSHRPRGTVPPFAVISGAQVQGALQGREKEIVELVAATYRLHGAGDSVNPPSYFLRFPDRPSSRIIALPASIGGPIRVDGLKWISSFPENVAAGIPRASAVLILNDHDTGYPFACLESSIISATRTAASAALAADWLTRGRPRPTPGRVCGDGSDRPLHSRSWLAPAGRSMRWVCTTCPVTTRPGSPATWSSPTRPAGSAVYDSAEALIRFSDWWCSPRSLPSRMSTRCRGLTIIRWCCMCRCVTWRRRFCSPRPMWWMTSSIV